MAKYNRTILKQIVTMTEDGHSIVEICAAVGIARETYFDWKKNKPDFSDKIKAAEGKRWELRRTSLEPALKKLIEGFEVEYIETTAEQDGFQQDGTTPKYRIVSQTKKKKIFPPNQAIVTKMLEALEPGRFRSDSTLNLNVKTISEMTQFSIKRRAQQTLPGAIINQQPNEDNYHEPEA